MLSPVHIYHWGTLVILVSTLCAAQVLLLDWSLKLVSDADKSKVFTKFKLWAYTVLFCLATLGVIALCLGVTVAAHL